MGVGGGYCEYPGKKTTMPILSSYAQKKKARYFLDGIPKDFRILEVGCGNGWAGNYLKEGGWEHYVGLDLVPPADIVGDIRNWKNLGIEEESFDVIIVFEVVEHVDCFDSCYDILCGWATDGYISDATYGLAFEVVGSDEIESKKDRATRQPRIFQRCLSFQTKAL